jgi:hypothetical protein
VVVKLTELFRMLEYREPFEKAVLVAAASLKLLEKGRQRYYLKR